MCTDGICRVIREQDVAKTPLDRLLQAKPPISRQTAQQPRAILDSTNPRVPKQRIHERPEELYRTSERAEMMSGRGTARYSRLVYQMTDQCRLGSTIT